MKEVTTIGLDLAKSVFQVHGIDASGKVVIRRQLRRSQVLAFFKKLPPSSWLHLASARQINELRLIGHGPAALCWEQFREALTGTRRTGFYSIPRPSSAPTEPQWTRTELSP